MHQLALRLGRTIAELQRTISAKELRQWWVFNKISPIGDERADLLNGILVANMCNIAPGKKRGKIFKAIDFMPYVDKKTKSQALSRQIRQNFIAYSGGPDNADR